MAENIKFEIHDTLSKGVHEFRVKTGSVTQKGSLIHDSWAAVGLSLLNFSANGSPNNSAVPPIWKGILRGSGSVFIGSTLLQTLPLYNGKGTPNTSHSEKEGVITIGYNTAYAARIHENLTPAGNYNLGQRSKDSGDVKGGWLRSHLQSDGDLIMRLFANLVKKGIG